MVTSSSFLSNFLAMSDPKSSRRALWAFTLPFALFIIFQAVPGLLKGWMSAPEQWVYPLQTAACAAALAWYWGEYPQKGTARGLAFGGLIGVVVLAVWIAPQAVFHAAPRVEAGFNPEPLRGTGWYVASVGARFVRLAVVVPLLEEIFWRGFLLRYLVREQFADVPFGTYTHVSFWGVTLGFMLEHQMADWPGALVAGALYNLVAVRTRSLPACVLAHAVTNLLLGVYIMQTKQWGFW